MEFSRARDILAVIVLYKMRLEESSTFVTLTKSLEFINTKLDIFVYDNSPEAQEINPNENWTIYYVHDENNPGVSTAYNYASDYAEKQAKKWLLLLDQDSTFPVESLKHYIESISTCDTPSLVVPRLFSSSGVCASPARYILHRGSHLNHLDLLPGLHDLRRRSFLNSGSLVLLEAYRKIGGFDEELFYYSDHDFFFRFNEYYNKYFLLNIDVIHDVGSAEIGRERFDLLLKAINSMSRKYKTFWPYVWLLNRIIKLTIITFDNYYISQLIKKITGCHND